MPLFESTRRTDASPSRHGERIYSFLNRVDGPGDRLRRTLDESFERCAPEQQTPLATRCKSPQSTPFLDAFWELYLHEALLRSGLTLRYELSSVCTGAPDYLVSDGRRTFWLEATVLHERNEDH